MNPKTRKWIGIVLIVLGFMSGLNASGATYESGAEQAGAGLFTLLLTLAGAYLWWTAGKGNKN